MVRVLKASSQLYRGLWGFGGWDGVFKICGFGDQIRNLEVGFRVLGFWV